MTDFWSMPMTAGRTDIPVGVDELGNVMYQTPSGVRYVTRQQAAPQGSVVKGAWNALKDDPWGTAKGVAAGAIDGIWQGISAPGRAAAGEPVTYGDVAATAMDWALPQVPGIAGAKYDPNTVNMGIRAYHGSPHDFDKFSMDKIGTGEGAQAYGHGLYFAEAEDVAKGYRDDLTDPDNFPLRIKDEPLNTVWNNELRERFPDMYRGLSEDDMDAMDGILGTLEGVTTTAQARDVVKYSMPKEWQRLAYRRVVPELKQPEIGPGHMYEVEINADPDDFLDWDAPLSEQPEKVRNAVNARLDQLRGAGARIGEDPSGDMLVRAMSPQGGLDEIDFDIGPRAQGSNNMREQGIPGIKYYDGNSRADGTGTRNYVVFDDNLIDIIRKYGWAGTAPLFANALAQPDEPQY